MVNQCRLVKKFFVFQPTTYPPILSGGFMVLTNDIEWSIVNYVVNSLLPVASALLILLIEFYLVLAICPLMLSFAFATMLSSDKIKELVGRKAAALVQPGITLGLGSGTTMYFCIMALAEKVKEGLNIVAVPTSGHTKKLAEENGIPLTTLNDITAIDLTIDGADEIDPQLVLIKGGGGALLQEKMVAAASRELLIIADETKLVQQLGRFPLPVEVVPFGWKQVQRHIEQSYAIQALLRTKDNQPYITDNHNYLLDCHFLQIADAPSLNIELNLVPGVVENGLFINMAASALIGFSDGSMKVMKP
jgi:ribose 5-phosphate isomerase A